LNRNIESECVSDTCYIPDMQGYIFQDLRWKQMPNIIHDLCIQNFPIKFSYQKYITWYMKLNIKTLM